MIGAICCAYLLGPWARLEADMVQYKIAGGLLAVGVVLWALTWLTNRGVRAKKTGFRDIDHLGVSDARRAGPTRPGARPPCRVRRLRWAE